MTRAVTAAIPSGLACRWRVIGNASCACTTVSRVTTHVCRAALCMGSVSYSSSTSVLLQSWAQRTNRVWMCIKEECRHVSVHGATHCEACGEAKPNLKGWLCTECNSRNHQGVKKCSKCGSSWTNSSEFWMCIACEKNNRIDDLDDNSRCGFCGYDMAPMTMTESEALRIQHERSERLREAQEQFDSLSARDADEQFGDETAGASNLPKELQQPIPVVQRPALNIPEVKPFSPMPLESSHSRILKKPRPSSLLHTTNGPPGFDWMCRQPTCGAINSGDEENCSGCGARIEPSEWECCHCGAMNHMSRAKCFNCHITISVSWVCPACNAKTSIYDRNCRQCDQMRPPTEPKDARTVQQQCLSSHRGARGRSPFRQDWHCAECQGLNFASRTACFQCGASRSTADAAFSTGAGHDGAPNPALSHNNWFCRHCQASNFRTRTSCWQCGRASSESDATSFSEESSVPRFEKEGFQENSDASAAEGQVNVWSKKSEEWTCGKCFSKNFKNRQECHKCGAAKTVAVAPRRAMVRKPVKI
ncbi:hypothetical protein TRVL_08220 [Trypanosoma vivax]|nr:hypothetical protein TRVL_08220 [Trypanosoma vivax]